MYKRIRIYNSVWRSSMWGRGDSKKEERDTTSRCAEEYSMMMVVMVVVHMKSTVQFKIKLFFHDLDLLSSLTFAHLLCGLSKN